MNTILESELYAFWKMRFLNSRQENIAIRIYVVDIYSSSQKTCGTVEILVLL